MTRRRLYLLGIGLFLLLLTGAVARVWLQPWADPLEVAAGRMKAGMTVLEVETIVGRQPDFLWYAGDSSDRSYDSVWESERGYLAVHYVIQNDGHIVTSARYILSELAAQLHGWSHDLHAPDPGPP
jgi:hypothetical protein